MLTWRRMLIQEFNALVHFEAPNPVQGGSISEAVASTPLALTSETVDGKKSVETGPAAGGYLAPDLKDGMWTPRGALVFATPICGPSPWEPTQTEGLEPSRQNALLASGWLWLRGSFSRSYWIGFLESPTRSGVACAGLWFE